MINTASELYNKILNIYETQYDKFSIARKERINVLKNPGNLTLDLYLDDLPLKDEEVKSKPEETIAERVNLNPRKRKKNRNRIKILTPN